MNNRIEVDAETSGVDAIERLISAVERLEGSLAKLGGNNNAMTRMARQFEAMNKTMKAGFDNMIELQSSMEARSARMAEIAGARRLAQAEEKADREVRAAAAAAEKKLLQQIKFEQRQEASANKFHYGQIELQDTLQVKQLDSYVKFWEKIVATQVAAENTQKAIQERRDTEMHTEGVKSAAEYVSTWEKMLAERQAIQERRDTELNSARAREFNNYVGWWDKTLAEQDVKQAKQLEMARMQQYELAGIRGKATADAAAATERQRLLNTSFLTSPLSGQIATAEKAVVYSSLGGNASEKFGAAAATADIAALRAQHALLPAAVNSSAEAMRAHNAVMDEGHALARGLAGSLGGLWLTYGSLVPLVAGAALAGSMKAVITAGKEVEYQLKFVQALGGGSVGLDSLLHITDQTVVSVKEAAEGMRALAQNGLSAADSLKVLPSILNLAVIGEMSVSNAALAATGTVSAFGLQLSDLDRVSNIFAKAAATSNTSVSAMTESMKQASTVAGIYGASVEETAAGLGVLAKVNIIGSAAGTAYTNMLTNLYTPTEKAKKALAELKITTDDGNGGLKNSTVLLGELRNALAGFNESSQATFLGDIFTVRGQKGASTILSNWDEYIKKTNEARNVTNFMGEAVAMLEDSTTGALKRLANNASASLDRAFSSSSPALQVLITHLAEIAGSRSVVDMLTGIADALLRLTKVVMDHSSAIGAMLAIYVGMRALSALPALFTAITAGVDLLSISMRGLTAAMGWIGVAVTAATLAYTLFIEKTSEAEKADQRRQNSIQVNIEYLDREIARLTERNKLWNPQTLQFDKAPQPNDPTTLDTANQAFDKKSRELAAVNAQVSKLQPGDFRISAFASQQASLERQVEDLARKRWELTAKQENFDVQSSIDQTRRGQESTVNAINNFIRQGEAYDKLSANYAGKDNEAFLRKTQQAKALREQMVAGTLSNSDAVAQLSALKSEASALLASRAPKPDPKGDNDRLNADLKRLDLELALARLQSQADISNAKQQNRRGELGDLALINVELAEKLALDQKIVDVARQQYERTTDVKDKKALGQKYTNEVELAKARAVVETNAAAEARLTALDRMAQQELQFEAKTLADKGELVQAFLKTYEAQYSVTIAKVTDDLEKSRDANTTAALASYLLFLTRLQKAGTDDALGKQMKTQFDVAFDALALRLQVLSNNSGPGAGLSAIFDNALRAEKDFSDSLPALMKKQAEMQALADSTQNPNDQKNATNELKRLEDMGARVRGIWTTIGKDIENSLTAAFDKPGRALGGLIARSLEYAVKQKQIDSDLAKNSVGASTIKLAELQKKAAEDSASAQVSAYGDMAGAAKGFFNEQSGGYKILATAEKAFRVAELAMTFEAMAAKLFATTTVTAAKGAAVELEGMWELGSVAPVVAAEGAKSSAYGITALAASLALPFPANLGAYAIVAGMLATIGIAVAGSGGSGGPPLYEDRQKKSGTGSVFGESLAKSDSIAKSMKLIEANTFQDLTISAGMLASLQNIERGIGGLGALVTRQVGQGTAFGDIKDTRASLFGDGVLAKVLTNPLVSIVGWLVGKFSSIKTTVSDQGLNLNTQTLGDTIRNGASGTSYADINTKKSFLGITYSNSNARNAVGLPADTLQQFTLVIANLRSGVLSAANAIGEGGDAFVAKLDAINVGITNLSTKGLTGEQIQQQLEAAFSVIGDTLAKEALGGLEQFAKVGEGYLETVMRVAAGYQTVDTVFQSFGKTFGAVGIGSIAARQGLIDLAGGLEQFTSQGAFFLKNFFTDAEQAKALRDRIDPTLQKYGLSTAGADATKQFKNFVVALDTTTVAGAEAYTELMRIAPAFKAVVDGLDEVGTAAKALQDQVDGAAAAMSNVDAAFSVLDRSVKASMDVLTARINKEKALSDALHGTLDSMEAQVTGQEALERQRAQAQVKASLAIAKAGGPLPSADDLKKSLATLGKDSSLQFKTMADYLFDQRSTQNDLTDLADLADNALSIDQKSLNTLQGILDAAQEQVDLLKGDSSGLSVAEALNGLQLAITGARQNPIVGATPQIVAAYQASLGRAPDQAGMDFWQKQAAGGMSPTTIASQISGSAEAQLQKLYQNLLGRSADTAGLAYWLNTGASMDQIGASIQQSPEYQAVHANSAQMASFSRASGNDDLLAALAALQAEVALLREHNSAENVAIAKNTMDAADHLDDAINGQKPLATKEVA